MATTMPPHHRFLCRFHRRFHHQRRNDKEDDSHTGRGQIQPKTEEKLQLLYLILWGYNQV
jgi:hypothetical protein